MILASCNLLGRTFWPVTLVLLFIFLRPDDKLSIPSNAVDCNWLFTDQ